MSLTCTLNCLVGLGGCGTVTSVLGGVTAPLEAGLFSLLASARRREVLSVLDGADAPTVEDLAERIAAREAGAPSTHEVEVSLVHAHLPKLEAAGLLEYDDETGEVTLTADVDDLRPYLERTAEAEPTDS